MEHIATIKLKPTFFAGSQPPIPAARKEKKCIRQLIIKEYVKLRFVFHFNW